MELAIDRLAITLMMAMVMVEINVECCGISTLC